MKIVLIVDGLIQRCSVDVEVLPAPISESGSRKRRKYVITKIDPRIIPTVCVYCNVQFSCKLYAFQHAAKDHKDIEIARCHYCQLCFRSKIDLLNHKKEFHKFICFYCLRYLRNEMAYQKHVSSMHSNEVIECKLCIKSFAYFKTQDAYNRHFARKHEGKWNCMYCKYENNFRLKISLHSHIRTHHKNELIECSHSRCANFFKNEAEKSEHEIAVHASRADEIECEICKVKVELPHINEHMRQFHNRSRARNGTGDKTSCCYCQKSFQTKAAVMRHVKEYHKNIETFKCDTCKLYLESLELKKKHYEKKHRGTFTCLYCSSWSCTVISNLRRHLREKHKGEVIQCKYSNMCSLYFKTHGELQKHISESHES